MDDNPDSYYYLSSENYEDHLSHLVSNHDQLTLALLRKHYLNVIRLIQDGDIPTNTFVHFYAEALINYANLKQMNQNNESEINFLFLIEYNMMHALTDKLKEYGYHHPAQNIFKNVGPTSSSDMQPMDISFEQSL